VEYKAYSLLGIFEISMPLLYGEEEHAFIRLRKEVERLTQGQENLPQYQKLFRATDPRVDKVRIEADKGGLLKESYQWILQHADFQH
jgi:hypothetical protein